jgi:uncharacterized membrane protein YdjX (TVP38/TMEM64 family)
MNNNTWIEQNQSKIWKAALALVLIVLATIVALHQDTHKLQAFITRYGKLSVLVCLIIYALLGATPVPSEPITLLITGLYGPWIATAIAAVGNTLAALIEFFIGGRINDFSDFEKKKANLPFHLGEIPINSPLFLILGRMLPGFGPKFVSIASGMYQVPVWTYIWTALVSNTIGAALVAGGGYGIFQLF